MGLIELTVGHLADQTLSSSRKFKDLEMKAAAVFMLGLVVVGMSSVEAGTMRKRFLIKEIQHAIDSVGNWFTKTYNSAKDSFNKLVKGVNFDAAVNALIPYIHSGMTVTACTSACVAASASVLGPAAPLAGSVCTPVCEGALAKLEELAG